MISAAVTAAVTAAAAGAAELLVRRQVHACQCTLCSPDDGLCMHERMYARYAISIGFWSRQVKDGQWGHTTGFATAAAAK
eukprot:scaffold43361_cov18-Tisochrysis_lutea.AAC.1